MLAVTVSTWRAIPRFLSLHVSLAGPYLIVYSMRMSLALRPVLNGDGLFHETEEVDLDLDQDRDLNPDANYIINVLTKNLMKDVGNVIYAVLIYQAFGLLGLCVQVANLLLYIYLCSGIQYKDLLD